MGVSALGTVTVAVISISKRQFWNTAHFLHPRVHSGQTEVRNYLTCVFPIIYLLTFP